MFTSPRQPITDLAPYYRLLSGITVSVASTKVLSGDIAFEPGSLNSHFQMLNLRTLYPLRISTTVSKVIVLFVLSDIVFDVIVFYGIYLLYLYLLC